MAEKQVIVAAAVLGGLLVACAGIGAVLVGAAALVLDTPVPVAWEGPAPSALPERLYPLRPELAESWREHADSRYDAACILALDGDPDAALYWLQEAALLEGIDVGWAHADRDLESLWADPSWPAMSAFMAEASAYWGAQGLLLSPHYLPEEDDYTAVLWLHGVGAEPAGLVDNMRWLAEDMDLGILGVSGTRVYGPEMFEWSEDLAADHAHIQRGLAALPRPPGEIVLLGFSQGAQLAVELVAEYPQAYAGAIALSPGYGGSSRAARGMPVKAGADSHVVIAVGAGEAIGTLALARRDAAWLEAAGVSVELRIAPEQSDHAFPPDFMDLFFDWVDACSRR